MSFRPFAVEQFLSENEHNVAFNFSESGVHPLTYKELLDIAGVDPAALLDMRVDYPQVNGSELLRGRIAAIYGATPDQVLVTVGATEANTLVAATLLEPGDNLVHFRPTYEQLPGNAANLGFETRAVPYLPETGWGIDHEALEQAVDHNTRIIHVVNPNNPTGRVLSAVDRQGIIDTAARVGAWIVADEVYAGTERKNAEPTASFWGSYDRVIAINSMSKAYGLPGLRLGWMVAPEPVISACWRRHEYAAISATTLAMALAEAALAPAARAALMARARKLIRRGFDRLQSRLDSRPGRFSVVPPEASAMSFVGFDLPVSSQDLALTLLREQDLLLIPGAEFGIEARFRFSSALPDSYLDAGLDRLILATDKMLEA